MRLLRRASIRHFERHPWQGALAVIGITLGVAIVVAVDLATTSARRAFELSSSAVFGRATHQVTAGSAGLPDSVYRILRVELAVEAAPVVEAPATLRTRAGSSSVRVLGVDPFAEAPFRSYLDAEREDMDLALLLTMPGAVLLPAELAQQLGVDRGDSISIALSGEERRAWVAGLVQVSDELSRRAISDLVLCDVSVAQELSGRIGRLDRIDLRVAGDSAGASQLEQIRQRLPGAEVVDASARSQATAGMTRAFELNLNAFALITLVFGALLIYDAMSFSVVQRREWIGRLRAVGVTRGEIFRLLLVEALAMGAIGTLFGLAAGVALAGALVRLVAQTINDLYFAVTVSGVTVSLPGVVKGIVLGIGATILAAASPVFEATSTSPRLVLARSVLESRTRRAVHQAALLGALLLVMGIVLAALPGTGIGLSFAALFAVAFAAALIAPLATVVLMRVVRPLASTLFGRLGSMAVRGVSATLSRTGPAVAALMVAVSVGAAVSIMVSSFRLGVERWLSASLQADIYVSSPSGGGGRGEGTLRESVISRIESAPEVLGVTRYRQALAPLGASEVRLVAVDLFERHRKSFTFLEGHADSGWTVFDRGGLLVSEAFAFRYRVHPGDTVRLTTERGPHKFPVAAVYRDYSSEFGIAFLDRSTYDAFWNDAGVSSLALWLKPDARADSLVDALRGQEWGQQVNFRSNRGLRDATLAVFDRTFTITRVLRALAVIVAFAGVLAALMALQLERARELGVLRATGLTPVQVWGLVTAQTGLLGLAAGLLALPLASGLAWLLINVVNRRAFGWTMQMHLDASDLLQALGLAVLSALLAGAYPARRMSRTPPAAALREE